MINMSELAQDIADFSPEHVAEEVDYRCATIANTVSHEVLGGATHMPAHILYASPELGSIAMRPLGKSADTFRFELGLASSDDTLNLRLVYQEIYGQDPDDPGHKKLTLVPEQPITAEDMASCPWPLGALMSLVRGLHDGYQVELERNELAPVVLIADHPRHISYLGTEAIKHAG